MSRASAGMPAPPTRGPLLSAEGVVARIGLPGIDARFVRQHIRPRVQLSPRRAAWYEADVDAWLEARRETPASAKKAKR